MEKSDDITPKKKPPLGKLLSSTRTKRALSQEDIAKELNLTKAIINALENDELIEGISPTYTRGYQRAYIRVLELDEVELLGESIAAPQFSDSQENLGLIKKDISSRGFGDRFSFPFRIFLPILLIGSVIIFWMQISSTSNHDDLEQTTQAVTPLQQKTETQVIQTVEIKPVTIEESITVTVDSAKESIAIDEQTQTITENENIVDDSDQVTVVKVIDPTTSETEESADSQEKYTKVTFIANGESWLDIRDAENTRLFRSILKLDEITVTGVLPLRIRTGNLQVLRVRAGQGEQRKVDVFNDLTSVANFLVEKDESGRLKFTAQ